MPWLWRILLPCDTLYFRALFFALSFFVSFWRGSNSAAVATTTTTSCYSLSRRRTLFPLSRSPEVQNGGISCPLRCFNGTSTMFTNSFAFVAGEYCNSYKNNDKEENPTTHHHNHQYIKKQYRMVGILTKNSLRHCGLSCIDTMFEIIHCEKHSFGR